MAETVKVVRDGPRGWHLINKQDFDPEKHVLWEPEIAAKEAEIKAAAEAEKLAAKEAKRVAAEAAKKAAAEAEAANKTQQS